MTPPIRVLHLFGRSPDFQTERSSAVLRRTLGDEFATEVRSIGRGDHYRHVPGAAMSLRRTPFDLVHAWDERALMSAVIGCAAPIIYTPGAFPTHRQVNWLRAILHYRDVRLACATATQQRVMVERGFPADRCQLIRPGVEFARIRHRRDATLRQSLGFAPEDRVLLAVGESTEAAFHELAVWASSMLHILDPRYKLLLWGRGRHVTRAARLGARLGQPNLVRVAEQSLSRPVEFEQLLSVMDVALVTARGPISILPIISCMAAGLPIISTVTYTLAELLEDRHTALMISSFAPRLLARRVLELHDDPALQWTIADRARTEAYEFFSVVQFTEEFRMIYRQALSDASPARTLHAPLKC